MPLPPGDHWPLAFLCGAVTTLIKSPVSTPVWFAVCVREPGSDAHFEARWRLGYHCNVFSAAGRAGRDLRWSVWARRAM